MVRDKLIFVHATDNNKFVNDAICGKCGKEVPADELMVLDPANAASRSGGIRAAYPSEVEYYTRTREYPAQPSADAISATAKAHEDYRAGFEDSIARAVAKALAQASKSKKGDKS